MNEAHDAQAELAELKAAGMTVLHDVISPDDIKTFKEKLEIYRREKYPDDDPADGELRLKSALLWSDEVARAVTNPRALWLARTYLETDDIHFCHQPVIMVLKPAKAIRNTFPPGGWHSDYPYHPGVFDNNDWPVSPPLGLQFNICIDDFTAETAGTQYVPGSHLEGRWPPKAFNENGTHVGEGVHKDVQQVIAPAGSAVIYDARTWHRACHELNVSGKDRLAILNAVAPAWVRPMMDKSWLTDAFAESSVAKGLDSEVRAELDRLCHTPTLPTPEGMPTLNERGLAAARPKE